MRGEGSVLMISGEVDHASAPRWQKRIATVLDGQPSVLVLDFSEVTFMDSAGLNMLVEARKKAVSHQIRIELRNPSPRVKSLLDMSGIAPLF